MHSIMNKIHNYIQDYCNEYKNKFKIKRVTWSSVVRYGFTYSKHYYNRSCHLVDHRLFHLPKHILVSDEEYDDDDYNIYPLKRCKPVHMLSSVIELG